jgi:hypothetical protein
MTSATSVVATDLFCIDHVSAGIWETFNLNASALAAYVGNNIVVPGTIIPGELQIRDGWSVEFFEDYVVGANPTLDAGIGWAADGAGSGLSIVNNNIYTGQTENRLQISGGQYGRTMLFGDFWNRIQIGIMFRINGVATFTGDGYVGLCSGTTNMVASATTDNFVGIRWSTQAGGWVFSNGTRVDKYTQATSTRFSTRRAVTTTDQGGGVGSDGRVFSATEGYRSMLFLEIARPVFANDATSVTYDLGMRSTSNANVEFSFSKRSFIDTMLDTAVTNLATMATGAITLGAGPVVNSFAFDQSTGKLDTLNISWPNTSELIEITALAVRKVY